MSVADQRRLRLDRDHARAEAAEGGDAVADMRADVEDEIAGRDEAAVEPVHGGAVRAVAVIDAQRADDAANGAPRLAHVRQGSVHASDRADISIAGSASARSSAGGAVSSGSRPSPMRISARPTAGEAVTTASGIDSSGPPAMNSA